MRSLTTVADRILRALVPTARGAAQCAATALGCGPCRQDPSGRRFRTCCYIAGQCHEVCTTEEC